ncbi:unnamed protein product [Lampetra planeri]
MQIQEDGAKDGAFSSELTFEMGCTADAGQSGARLCADVRESGGEEDFQGSMPAVFILLRSLVIRLLGSRLAGSVVQLLRRSLSSGASHLGTALRHVWDRIRSQESKEAVLGCVLCILNMHKKVEN